LGQAVPEYGILMFGALTRRRACKLKPFGHFNIKQGREKYEDYLMCLPPYFDIIIAVKGKGVNVLGCTEGQEYLDLYGWTWP